MTRTVDSSLEYVDLARLANAFGDSFYLLDPTKFRNNITRFRDAFRTFHSKTELAYSYKTNYIPLLCNIARQSGLYAEVVSPLEYKMAARLGNEAHRIIFNGPIKPCESIAEALANGSIVNLDSIEEYDFVERLAARHKDREFRVGLRCNIGVEPPQGSRFGIQTATGELETVFNRLHRTSNIRVNSLHTHYSHQRDAASFATRARKLGEIYDRYRCDHPISIFDLGGGFFSPMSDEIASQFATPPPSYEQYANAVGPIISKIFENVEDPPELVLEPGVGVVADVLTFVCRVESLKTTKTRIIANTTGGVQNIKPSKSNFNLPMRVVNVDKSTPGLAALPVDICGFTCMEDDVLFRGYPNRVSNGDFLVFNNVGAYSVTFKPQFIRSAPPILFRESEGRQWQLARRRETLDDILSTYEFVGRKD